MGLKLGLALPVEGLAVGPALGTSVRPLVRDAVGLTLGVDVRCCRAWQWQCVLGQCWAPAWLQLLWHHASDPALTPIHLQTFFAQNTSLSLHAAAVVLPCSRWQRPARHTRSYTGDCCHYG